MTTAAKAAVRRLVARVIEPHLERQTAEIERRIASQFDPPLDPLLTDFYVRLHELRSIELRRLGARHQVLLSAGCAGAWYFEWLEREAGPFESHIGVELYAPMPERLPHNVRWIAESAGSMPSVESDSVDVLFSGQNFEHLWSDMMVDFLCEANRVLRGGGRMVVDSPNRLAVEALGWNHPEHTIEITAAEATRLFELAGFRVTDTRGLWRCRSRDGKSWLPLIENADDISELMERSVGRRHVDDDFVWWIECEKITECDRAGLRAAASQLFAELWTPRVNRAAMSQFERNNAGELVAPAGASGVLYRTHAFPLFAGSYQVTASDPRVRLELSALDGPLLQSGIGAVTGILEESILGVFVELVADAPLDRDSEPLQVTVSVAV